jgi:endonuclease YncB( thermonuclease family)
MQGLRALILPAAALALAGAVVLVGGRMVDAPVAIDEPDLEAIALAEQAVASVTAPGESAPVEATRLPARVSAEAATEEAAPAVRADDVSTEALPSVPPLAAELENGAPQENALADPQSPAASRMVDPAIVAPPGLDAEGLQREAPREPLSQLSLALPPPPKMKNEWAGTPLFRPLATESAVFESGGRTIAISGVESVPIDENCVYEGASWSCGMRARTAFRLWLRGRALVCQLPYEEQAVTRARCRLAGCWRMAGCEWLGEGRARRTLCAGRGEGAGGQDGHLRRAAGHVFHPGCA